MSQGASCKNEKSKLELLFTLVTDLKNDGTENLLLIKVAGLIIQVYFVEGGRLELSFDWNTFRNSLHVPYEPVLKDSLYGKVC